MNLTNLEYITFMNYLKFITVISLLFIISCAPVKVACLGDSITYGSGIEGRDSLAYPQNYNSNSVKSMKL